ncbi:MAG: polysaccharide biosynthesis protein [Peptostreptococcaceae bacterium]
MFDDKCILITGGTGSWGKILTKRLLKENIKEIRIFSRNELAQVNMEREFNNPKIKYIIGDIRDLDSLRVAMKNIDYVFHLAALKHVPVCEYYPREAILTNINGTMNIINAAIENNVKKVIDVSTDKAVSPYNLYGMTKAVGEKLIINANTLNSNTSFVCIRGGNVIGSNGSVIPFFIDQIKKNNKITVTHPDMTRYFITLEDAINLLINASKISFGGETIVMNMPACKISDLSKVLISHYGDDNTKIEIIGLRPGEKMHEELISEHESPYTYRISDLYYSISPTIHIDNADYYNLYKKVSFKSFNSSQNLMTIEELTATLKKSNFI